MILRIVFSFLFFSLVTGNKAKIAESTTRVLSKTVHCENNICIYEYHNETSPDTAPSLSTTWTQESPVNSTGSQESQNTTWSQESPITSTWMQELPLSSIWSQESPITSTWTQESLPITPTWTQESSPMTSTWTQDTSPITSTWTQDSSPITSTWTQKSPITSTWTQESPTLTTITTKTTKISPTIKVIKGRYGFTHPIHTVGSGPNTEILSQTVLGSNPEYVSQSQGPNPDYVSQSQSQPSLAEAKSYELEYVSDGDQGHNEEIKHEEKTICFTPSMVHKMIKAALEYVGHPPQDTPTVLSRFNEDVNKSEQEPEDEEKEDELDAKTIFRMVDKPEMESRANVILKYDFPRHESHVQESSCNDDLDKLIDLAYSAYKQLKRHPKCKNCAYKSASNAPDDRPIGQMMTNPFISSIMKELDDYGPTPEQQYLPEYELPIPQVQEINGPQLNQIQHTPEGIFKIHEVPQTYPQFRYQDKNSFDGPQFADAPQYGGSQSYGSPQAPDMPSPQTIVIPPTYDKPQVIEIPPVFDKPQVINIPPVYNQPQVNHIPPEMNIPPLFDKTQTFEIPPSFNQIQTFEMPPSLEKIHTFKIPQTYEQPQTFEMPPGHTKIHTFEIPPSHVKPQTIDIHPTYEMPPSHIKPHTYEIPPSYETIKTFEIPPTRDKPHTFKIPPSYGKIQTFEIPPSHEKPHTFELPPQIHTFTLPPSQDQTLNILPMLHHKPHTFEIPSNIEQPHIINLPASFDKPFEIPQLFDQIQKLILSPTIHKQTFEIPPNMNIPQSYTIPIPQGFETHTYRIPQSMISQPGFDIKKYEITQPFETPQIQEIPQIQDIPTEFHKTPLHHITQIHKYEIPQMPDYGVPHIHEYGIPQIHEFNIPQVHDLSMPQIQDREVDIPTETMAPYARPKPVETLDSIVPRLIQEDVDDELYDRFMDVVVQNNDRIHPHVMDPLTKLSKVRNKKENPKLKDIIMLLLETDKNKRWPWQYPELRDYILQYLLPDESGWLNPEVVDIIFNVKDKPKHVIEHVLSQLDPIRDHTVRPEIKDIIIRLIKSGLDNTLEPDQYAILMQLLKPTYKENTDPAVPPIVDTLARSNEMGVPPNHRDTITQLLKLYMDGVLDHKIIDIINYLLTTKNPLILTNRDFIYSFLRPEYGVVDPKRIDVIHLILHYADAHPRPISTLLMLLLDKGPGILASPFIDVLLLLYRNGLLTPELLDIIVNLLIDEIDGMITDDKLNHLFALLQRCNDRYPNLTYDVANMLGQGAGGSGTPNRASPGGITMLDPMYDDPYKQYDGTMHEFRPPEERHVTNEELVSVFKWLDSQGLLNPDDATPNKVMIDKLLKVFKFGDKESGVVELTYMLKHEKPLIYQPVYYVKYRLPILSFISNMKNLIHQQPRITEDPIKLLQELIVISNLTEVSPNLQRYPKDEIVKLTVNDGDLVQAKILDQQNLSFNEQISYIHSLVQDISPEEILQLNRMNEARFYPNAIKMGVPPGLAMHGLNSYREGLRENKKERKSRSTRSGSSKSRSHHKSKHHKKEAEESSS